jgi:hypothetical protein
MSDAQGAKYRNLFLIVSVILLALGAMAARDVKNQTYTGFQTDGNNKVTMVEEGGPAAAAGLQAGDVLTSVNGIAVTDTKGFFNLHRAAVGATWPYVIQRGGQAMTLEITQAALSTRYVYVARAATLLGFCYLGFTLWAYLSAPGAATVVLAWFGLSFGQSFLGTPYFESPAVRNAISTINTSIVLLGIAALVHFLLAFPTRRPLLERPSGAKLLYGPAIVVSLVNIGFSILQPDSTSGLNIFFRTLFTLLIAGYFLAAIVVLFRRYGAATPADRAAHGLGLMLAGAIIGLGPLLVLQIVTLLSPSTFLPQSQFYFLTLGLIPIAFSIAAVRSAGGRGSDSL